MAAAAPGLLLVCLSALAQAPASRPEPRTAASLESLAARVTSDELRTTITRLVGFAALARAPAPPKGVALEGAVTPHTTGVVSAGETGAF